MRNALYSGGIDPLSQHMLIARDDGVISSYEMLLRAFARAHCLDREPIRPLGQDELDRLTDRIAKALEALEIAEKWPK